MSFFLTLLAIIILIVGIVSMVTPIPGGVIMISGGVTLLICNSPKTRDCIRYIRTRVGWFNKFFFLLENKVGVRIKVIGHALLLTRPQEKEE